MKEWAKANPGAAEQQRIKLTAHQRLPPMLRTTITAIASAAALLAVSEPMDPPVAMADTVKDALCVLSRHDDALPLEEFRCDFTQLRGNVYVDSVRWAFAFPDAENGTTHTRQNTEDFKRFTREGQYTLTVFESGAKPNEPGGF